MEDMLFPAYRKTRIFIALSHLPLSISVNWQLLCCCLVTWLSTLRLGGVTVKENEHSYQEASHTHSWSCPVWIQVTFYFSFSRTSSLNWSTVCSSSLWVTHTHTHTHTHNTAKAGPLWLSLHCCCRVMAHPITIGWRNRCRNSTESMEVIRIVTE